jgi:adenylate cyclase 1
MESTGVPGYTQVTQEVVDALQGSHFEFKCRGQINVKGKGEMITYFLNDTKPKSEIGMDMIQMRHSNYHENANYQGSVINKEIYMKKKNFGNFLVEDNNGSKPSTSNNFYGNSNGMNLTENLNYVKREYDNYNKINVNNHYNINYQPQHVQQHYNIRENFNMNIIENPNEKQQQQQQQQQPHRNNYLDRGGEEHYNNFRNENEPLLMTANTNEQI